MTVEVLSISPPADDHLSLWHMVLNERILASLMEGALILKNYIDYVGRKRQTDTMLSAAY